MWSKNLAAEGTGSPPAGLPPCGPGSPSAVAVVLSVEGTYQPEWTGFDVVVHGLDAAPTAVRAGGEAITFDWDGTSVRFPLAVGDGFELVR